MKHMEQMKNKYGDQVKHVTRTVMQVRYIWKLIVRLIIFVVTLVLYLTNKDFLYQFMTHTFTFGISTYGFNFLHVLWLIFMVMMISHLFPKAKATVTMALRRTKKEEFQPVEGYSETDLLRYVQIQNVKAWQVMLIWLSFNAVFGILYLFNVLDSADLLMLTVFYFLCDYICILFFCPFQTYVMKNKCCVNCRIFDWGHFMMFTPMLFIKNFFSWSLFFTSLVVLIHWEILYARHPERFWEKSNRILQCANCKDKTCKAKKKLSRLTGH